MRKLQIINFTKDELDSLIIDENSCVTINNSTYSLALYPYQISNVSESIKRMLNAKVAKYDQRLDGIFLGYKNLKLITPYAALKANSCYIHVDIQGDFYIFRPKVGLKLTGVVNKMSRDHIGCLVHKVFNVSVPNKNENKEWPGFEVEIGNVVEISVEKTQLDGRLPYIMASIVSKKSDLLNGDESSKKQNKKKRKETEKSDLAEQTIGMKKQNKKRHSTDLTQFITEDTGNVNDSGKKHKKKKQSGTIDVKVEELSQDTQILNKSLTSKNKKKKHQSQEINEVTPQKSKTQYNGVTPQKSNTQQTNETDYFATPKIKNKKQKLEELEKNSLDSLEDFLPKEKKHKKRNSDKIETETDSTKKKKDKKRKSNEQKHLNISPIKPMAELKDRKHKKHRLSISQQVDLENKELNLDDSGLEKTLKTPDDKIKDMSWQFNLAKIEALNSNTPRKRKYKRKQEIEPNDLIQEVRIKRTKIDKDEYL